MDSPLKVLYMISPYPSFIYPELDKQRTSWPAFRSGLPVLLHRGGLHFVDLPTGLGMAGFKGKRAKTGHRGVVARLPGCSGRYECHQPVAFPYFSNLFPSCQSVCGASIHLADLHWNVECNPGISRHLPSLFALGLPVHGPRDGKAGRFLG